jgi:membrane protease YdiL (CAAX protease family)
MSEDTPAAASTPPAAPSSPLDASRALRIFMAYLGAQLAVAVIVGVLVATRNLTAGGPASPGGIQLDPWLTLAAALVATLVAGLVVLRMVRTTFAREGGDVARLAVGWKGASLQACARAALQGLGLVAAFVVVGSLLPSRPHDLGPLARAAMAGGGSRLVWAALAFLVAPPTEELVFRGALYAGLARSWRPAGAAAVTTAIFVGLHGTELGAYWPGWIIVALVGALALRARLATGSLLPAIALHASYNLGLVIAVHIQAGRP